jgi:PrtD family type I secretion system ABC transporter
MQYPRSGSVPPEPHEIREYLRRIRPIFFSAGAFSLVTNLLMLVPSLYMLQVYDRVLTSRNLDTLLMLSLLVLALYIALALVEWVRSQLLVNAGVELDLMLAPRLLESFVKHRAAARGAAADAAFTDAATLRQFLTGPSLLALFDAPWVPVFLVVLYLLHPALAAVAVVGALLLVALTWVSQKLTRAAMEQASAQQGASHAAAHAYGRNHEAILAMGMLGELRARWLAAQEKMLALQARTTRRAGALAATSRLIRMVQQTTILGVGALLVVKGEVSPGALIASSILLTRSLAPLDVTIASWRQFSAALAAYRRLGTLLARVPPEQERIQLPPPTGDVAIENLTIVPPGATAPAVADLDFRIKPGMAVGVIGPSGSGKSCLARAMTGVWVPARGAVRLDGASLAEWNRDQLGAHVGYLPQSIDLIEGTVAENIARFGSVDSDKVLEAARAAGVHEMIMRLPQGYETTVGPDGGNLSGGQRQRVALARALYGRPRWIVLDEPNSNLDEQGEAALLEALAAMKAWGATVVVVTHRRPLLAAMDGVLVLRDGRLVVYGPAAKVLQPAGGPGTPALRPVEAVR